MADAAPVLHTVSVKMEGNTQTAETISDIQNYLETFNEEIQGGDQSGIHHVTGWHIIYSSYCVKNSYASLNVLLVNFISFINQLIGECRSESKTCCIANLTRWSCQQVK